MNDHSREMIACNIVHEVFVALCNPDSDSKWCVETIFFFILVPSDQTSLSGCFSTTLTEGSAEMRF